MVSVVVQVRGASRRASGEPVFVAALSMGGHLRVGMEDVLTLARGVPVERNVQLVERAVAAAAVAQRTPMSPSAGRSLLGLLTTPQMRG